MNRQCRRQLRPVLGRGPFRRRLGRMVTGGAILAVGSMVTAPFLGTGEAASAATAPAPSGICTAGELSAPTNSAGQQIAGYTLTGLAAGFRYELDSPGLLPVGDPQKGNITELDVPFARENVSEGLVASRSSPAYPGDTAAGIGSALGEFGASGLPNDPVVASAAYPPSPDAPASSTFPPSAEPSAANAGTAQATADQNGGSSQSSVASFSLSSGGTQGAGGGPSQASSVAHVGTACVDSSARATTSDIVIAGVVDISGVSGIASAMSDGHTAVPHAALRIGNVTVGGMAAYIDRNGIHLASQQPLGTGVVSQAQSALDAALRAQGITVTLLAPVISTNGADATVDSGGLDIVVNQTLPATSVPGVPAISVPGAPPIPLGTPGAPLRYEVVYGKAQVTVDATSAPATANFALPPVGGLDQTAGTMTTGTGPGFGPAVSTAASLGNSLTTIPGLGLSPSSGSETSRLAAATGAPPVGGPAPVGWIIIGLLVSLMAAGPLLGYARWQLLEGRI
ncbi:MAG: hypothetical protein ACYCS7_00275 [Acidimicrobiales bacterium]